MIPSRVHFTPAVLRVAFALCAAMAGIGLLLVTISPQATAEDTVEPVVVTPGKADAPATLRDRLVVGLRARLKSEVTFCDIVAVRVQTGQIPQRLVDETFLWARQHAAEARHGRPERPIIYFQPAMKARAQRIGVTL
jgi:hypothetical protein